MNKTISRREILAGASAAALAAGLSQSADAISFNTPQGRVLLGSGGIPSWVQPGAIIDEDFLNQRAYPRPFASELVDARASDQWVPNASGLWIKASSGVLPVSSSYLEVEVASSNQIRNNTTQGATTGSPGAPGANWSLTQPGSGIAASIAGVSTQNGINYLDVLVAGTSTASISTSSALLTMETTTGIAALTGQTWTGSPFLAITSGSLGSSTLSYDLCERSSAGGLVRSNAVTISPSQSSLTLASRSAVTTLLSGGATTAAMQPQFRWGVASGVTVGFNLRIGWADAEQRSGATSPILTAGTAASRAANAITIQRNGIGRIVFTFDNNSQQTISGINTSVQYTIPTNLNRPLIQRMTGYAS